MIVARYKKLIQGVMVQSEVVLQDNYYWLQTGNRLFVKSKNQKEIETYLHKQGWRKQH